MIYFCAGKRGNWRVKSTGMLRRRRTRLADPLIRQRRRKSWVVMKQLGLVENCARVVRLAVRSRRVSATAELGDRTIRPARLAKSRAL